MAVWVAVEAPAWSTPPPAPVVFHDWGTSSRSTSQSSTWDSSSVDAGEVAHSIPCTPIPAAANSPSTAGGEVWAGKKANQPGCCQWARPGTTTRSRSARTASKGSGPSGASSGSLARTSPGSTASRTGLALSPER